MRIFLKVTTMILGLIISISSLAQVTIGMGEAPAKAALLQLKDQTADVSNVTSTKGGFLLPRVQLTNRSTLEPFISTTDANYTQEKSLSTGLLVYNVNEVANDSIYPGLYCWDGQKWVASSGLSNSGSVYTGSGAVKINVNQSDFISLSGTQSYGLLMLNQSITINPQYVTGVYPGGTTFGTPTSIITSATGNNGALLLEAPISGKANFYRMNMQFKMGNNPPAATRYFDVSVVSVGSGALVYQNSIVVPGGLATGHIAYFQIFFPSVADAASIGVGYRILFSVDTAASQGLPGNIGVKLVDVTRINQ